MTEKRTIQMDTVKIGLVGTGGMGKVHFANYAEIEEVTPSIRDISKPPMYRLCRRW